MSIFESLYNNYNEEKTKEHFNKEKYKVFIEKVERYCKKKKHNHKEEFLTQVFTHIMLADDLFRQAFLDKIEIVNGSWNFEAERFGSVENAGEKQEGEMDVFGTAENELLIIENKLNSEIQKEQPEKYKNICRRYKEERKYIVILTKFSGLISYWNSYNGGIKEKIVSELQEYIGKEYICNYIYWHEVYKLLEDNFSDTEIQQELLSFLKSQNLDQTWYQDMGCPFWRKNFNDVYVKLAQKYKLPEPEKKINKVCWIETNDKGEEIIKPYLGIIKLSGTDSFFAGARLQGARAAEQSGNCSILQLKVNGTTYDLSDCFNDDVETCVEKCTDAIQKLNILKF